METAFAQARSRIVRFECGEPERVGGVIRLPYAASDESGSAYTFTEEVEIPGDLDESPVVDGLVRLLSLAAALSYYKAFAPVEFAVPGGLTAAERRFVTELIRGGLGEFAVVNDMPEALDPHVSAPERAAVPVGDAQTTEARALVAVGGGKDSVVALEGLTRSGVEVGLVAANPRLPIERTAEVAGLDLHAAKRRLDPALLRLNDEGAPNGHVPVTAINSLIALLTAAAQGYDTVVFANEASASFGNQHWAGRDINHQWSKSSEFEALLRESLPTGSPEYVSLLRPLTEIRIARAFAELTDYHAVFTSCNRAFRLSAEANATWCGDCPKCRFVFLMLAPFLSRDALLDIFGGRDLFADDRQFLGFLELLGADGLVKPFECVGEPDECRVAVDLLRRHDDWAAHPFLARTEIAALTASDAERDGVFAWRGDEHFLSPALEAVAREI